MRLISAHIRGYGRIVDSKINLDAKVIAIVGPNESGKTTLLRALTHVDSNQAVPIPQRSRAAEVTNETRATTFDYIIEESDQDELTDLDLLEPPTRASISRTADGSTLYVDLSPLPVKSVKPLQAAIDYLDSSLTDEDIDHWIDPNTTYADPGSDAARDYRGELKRTIEALETAIAQLGTELPSEAVEIAQSLHDATLNEDSGAEQLRAAFRGVIDWAERPDPGIAARSRLWSRTPDFIMFNEADRSIQSTYVFDEALVNNLPGALKNLAGTASLDLPQLHHFVQTGDISRLRSAIVQANTRMDRIFGDAWKQSKLSVHFELDGNLLRIELMEDSHNVTLFDERSAGLRMFVALIAFLKVHGSNRMPILLIDEAENHLHIDAQADLVNMFVTQEHAVKVIYTTHSPACLPPDLGTGIRVVVPRADNFQISDVRNSFWQGAAGFSPLMLAMGAAAAAFTPARLVVLAEGATEMILLPTLMRAATGENELRYQVAPGLSEVPKEFMPRLDLEAARVAYLVDGDNGGYKLKKLLTGAGVPENLVAELGAPGIENLVELNSYRGAIAALLPECNPGVTSSTLPEIPTINLEADSSISKWIEDWFKSAGINGPSKVAVANWLVENDRAIPSESGARLLATLNQRLLVTLGVESDTKSTLEMQLP